MCRVARGVISDFGQSSLHVNLYVHQCLTRKFMQSSTENLSDWQLRYWSSKRRKMLEHPHRGFPYVCLDLGGHSSDHLIWKNLSICVLRRRRSISPLMYPRFLNIKSYFIRSSFGLSQWCWKVLNLISVHLPHEVFLSKRRTRLVLGVETLMWKEAMVAFALVAVSLPWSDRCMVVLNAWCVVVVVVIEV